MPKIYVVVNRVNPNNRLYYRQGYKSFQFVCDLDTSTRFDQQTAVAIRGELIAMGYLEEHLICNVSLID